jgi:hypothetical protein
MNLVDEQDRFPAGASETVLRRGDHFPHLGDVTLDAAQPFELRVGHVGDDMSERGFAGPGRAGQNQGGQPIGFDRASQKFSGRENVFLSDEFVEGARPHPSGEGSGSADAFLHFVPGFLKQILHSVKNTKRKLRRTLYSRACERP